MFCIHLEMLVFSHSGKDYLRTFFYIIECLITVYKHATVVDRSYIERRD